MHNRKDGEKTRQRILKVASRLFAEKGYRNTTHEQICRLAKVNSAAINYHFRKKETLYVEAWRTAYNSSLKNHPADGGIPAAAPAEERLRGRILSIIRRISDPENKVFDIIQKELANPTGLLSEVIRESIEPVRKGIESIVRELLGPGSSDQDVQLCHMSIMAQCFHPTMRFRKSNAPGAKKAKDPTRLHFDIEKIADHVTRFSIAGIRDIRKELEKKNRK